MDYSDFEEYNLLFQSEDDIDNIVFDFEPKDEIPESNSPTSNDDDDVDKDTDCTNPKNQNPSSTYLEKYSLSEKSQFELNLWFINHQDRPYMNVNTKIRFAKRLNVSVESISLFLCEKRRIAQIKNQNKNNK